MSKELCPGGGTEAQDVIPYRGLTSDYLGKCGHCGRVLKPLVHVTGIPVEFAFTLRQHSVRGRNTASHDTTMERLYSIYREVAT
jgi:hypothetical protein